MRVSYVPGGGCHCDVCVLATAVLVADGTVVSDFTAVPPLSRPNPGWNPAEATPITFGNFVFQQRSIADRDTQLADDKPNSGSWDMITVNETGPHKARYLFTVFETGQSGVQRHDLETGVTDTIWNSPAPGGHVSFDACYWTPWGTLITAEESWVTASGGSTSPYGRLFELQNPIDAPGMTSPIDNLGAVFLHQNVIPRTSHEGIQWDKT